jgi:hypothetical protein
MDTVLLVKDVWCHLRVPFPRQVSEVNTCIKQFLEICSWHFNKSCLFVCNFPLQAIAFACEALFFNPE